MRIRAGNAVYLPENRTQQLLHHVRAARCKVLRTLAECPQDALTSVVAHAVGGRAKRCAQLSSFMA